MSDDLAARLREVCALASETRPSLPCRFVSEFETLPVRTDLNAIARAVDELIYNAAKAGATAMSVTLTLLYFASLRERAGVTDFDARYAATLDAVRGDIALGSLLGVSSTPTFFINGVRVEGGLRPEYFDAAIASELNRKAGGAENQ